jgi:hypothetical protein
LQATTGPGRESIQRTLDSSRKQARRQIEARLKEIYLGELDRELRTEIQQMEPLVGDEEAKLAKEIARLVMLQSKRRGVVLARLAFLIGFPDPQTKAPANLPSKVASDYWAEVNRLRAELVKIDADFTQQANQATAQKSQTLDEASRKLRIRFAELQAAAEERAANEAEVELKRLANRVGLQLAERPPIRLPKLEGRSKTLTLPNTPINPVPLEIKDSIDHKAVVESQIDIWIALQGYERVKRSSQGRDATREFIEWRRNRHLGP